MPANPLHDTRPSPPWLAPRELARIALWLVDRVMTPTAEQRGLMTAALEQLDEAERGYADPYAVDLAREPTGSNNLVALALETARRADRNPAAAVVAAKRAAKLAAQLVRADRGDLRALIDALDERLFLVEVAALIEQRVEPAVAARVTRVMFRAEADQKGRVGNVVVRLGEDWGLLAKQKGRFRWFEGGRSEILATVPDAAFERAVDVIVARES